MKERIHWIDTAKGLAMLLVCLSHHAFNTAGLWITTFHMPLFFFLSGYCFHGGKDSFPREILRKAYRLLAIYFSYGIGRWMLLAAYSAITGAFSPNFNVLLGVFLILPTENLNNGIWFFPCLFVAYVLFSFVIRLLRRFSVPHIPVLMPAVTTALSITMWYTLGVRQIWLPWYADLSVYLLPHMALGYLLSQQNLGQRVRNFPRLARFGIACLGVAVTWGIYLLVRPEADWYVDYKLRALCEFIPILLCGAMGSVMIALISIFIDRSASLEYVGRNSAVYYLIQWRFAALLCNLPIPYLPVPGRWTVLIPAVLGSALLVAPICWVLNRWFPLLVGKKEPRFFKQ